MPSGDGQAVEMKTNPAEVYLSRWPRTSDTHKTMAGALRTVARTLASDGSVSWGLLRAADVRGVAADLQDEGLKPPTINKCLSALRGVLETAWRMGLIPDEEYRRIKIDNVAGKSLPAGRALDATEVDVIFEKLALETAPVAALIAVLTGCGLRRVEAVRLLKEDYEAGELVARGKGNKERSIPVPPRWRPLIEAWFSQLEDGARAFNMSRSTISYIIEGFIRRTGLRPFTPHDLRRTFITRVNENADIAIAQRLAGHSNLNTTAIYDRRGKSAEKKAVEDL